MERRFEFDMCFWGIIKYGIDGFDAPSSVCWNWRSCYSYQLEENVFQSAYFIYWWGVSCVWMGWRVSSKVNSIDKGCLWVIILVYLYYYTYWINFWNWGGCSWFKASRLNLKKWFDWRNKERWRRAYHI